MLDSETTRVVNEAHILAMLDEGYDKYLYLATLDSRTSVKCRGLDNKVFKISERTIGVNFPPSHTNCRCITVPYDKGRKNRVATNEDGEEIIVDAKMSYSEWLKQYEKGKVIGNSLDEVLLDEDLYTEVLLRKVVLGKSQ